MDEDQFVPQILTSPDIIRDITFNLNKGPIFYPDVLRILMDKLAAEGRFAPLMTIDRLVHRKRRCDPLSCKLCSYGEKSQMAFGPYSTRVGSFLRHVFSGPGYHARSDATTRALSNRRRGCQFRCNYYRHGIWWRAEMGTSDRHRQRPPQGKRGDHLISNFGGAWVCPSPIASPWPRYCGRHFPWPIAADHPIHVNRKYEGTTELKDAFKALLASHFVGPAEEGWKVPGFRYLSDCSFRQALRDPNQRAYMAERIKVGGMYGEVVNRLFRFYFRRTLMGGTSFWIDDHPYYNCTGKTHRHFSDVPVKSTLLGWTDVNIVRWTCSAGWLSFPLAEGTKTRSLPGTGAQAPRFRH